MDFLKHIIHRIKSVIFYSFVAAGYLLIPRKKFKFNSAGANLGLIVGEFFHENFGKFGGYGITAKNFTDYYNRRKDEHCIRVVIPQGFPVVPKPEIKILHDTPTLVRPETDKNYVLNFIQYQRLIKSQHIGLYLTIEYYSCYEYALLADPKNPVLIWIRDPRGPVEWANIMTVPQELAIRNIKNTEQILAAQHQDAESLHRLLRLSRRLKRKIIFVSNGHFLIPRAQGAYELPDLKAHVLFNPIPLPADTEIKFSEKPSLCFLGRLEPQKRFWMVGELAQRFPEVDFYIGGVTNFPELMYPILKRYEPLKNFKLLGMVDGQKKDELLAQSWGLINTSIHEGLPVSFLETMAAGKCVISCLNPENLVETFGFYTGEILGEGMDEASLGLFSRKIKEFLNDKKGRFEKGNLARLYIRQKHTFERFEERFGEILFQEGLN